MFDLFGHQQIDDFSWIVGVFTGNGAVDAIKKANEAQLRTYYPLRTNKIGELIPLWRNYLFMEFQECITIDLCRSSIRFLKIISAHDDFGVLKPVLVPKNAINENLRLVNLGKFNDKTFRRRFYSKGSLVRVIDGIFAEKRVRLEADVAPGTPSNKFVNVSIGGWNGKIEIFKLAL